MTKKTIVKQPDQNKQNGKPDPKKMNSDPKHQKELHKKTNDKGYNEKNQLNNPGENNTDDYS